jgi:hypothetical protein
MAAQGAALQNHNNELVKCKLSRPCFKMWIFGGHALKSIVGVLERTYLGSTEGLVWCMDGELIGWTLLLCLFVYEAGSTSKKWNGEGSCPLQTSTDQLISPD